MKAIATHIVEPVIGLICIALQIWLLTLGGLLGVIGDLLMLPGRIVGWIAEFLVALAGD